EQDVRDAGRAIFRPRVPQDGRGVRNPRRRTLRQQQLERTQRCLKSHAGAILSVEHARFGVRLIVAAKRAGENDGADRLLLGPAIRSRNAADRYRNVGFAARERTLSHRIDASDGHGAECIENIARDAEALLLGCIRVRHEPAIEDFRGPGNFGEGSCDKPAGAAFRQSNGSTRSGVFLDDPARQIDDVLRKQGIAHDERGRQTGNSRWLTKPAMAPSRPLAVCGSIGATYWMTRSTWPQWPVGILAEVS